MQINFEIPEIYKGLYDLADLQSHLQSELNMYLAERFGTILGQSMTEAELYELGQKAKQKAWEKYKGQFLADLDTQQ
jgi:hypothetical protein